MVEVNFDHSLFRCCWLWVGDNLCLLWDHLCLLYPQNTSCLCCWAQVPTLIFLFMSKISFEWHKQTIKKIPCRFKTWMGFVEQILIKLKTSFIWGFLQLPFDVLWGVTYANMLVAIQWPMKHAPHLPGSVWYGGLEAHWSYLPYDDPREFL